MNDSVASWKQKQDPPEFKSMLKMINECNGIKFASYRAAAKLRILQRSLHMDSVRLNVVAGVFNRHCLQVTENGVLLKYTELEAIIFDIFFATQKENSSQIDVDKSTGLMVYFLQSVFDRKTNGTVQVLFMKVALVVLSSAKLQEKYEYLFRQLADHNSCISISRLEKLLTSFAYISVYLNESTAFGFEHISSTLDSCFQQAQGTLGITEDMFIGWLLNEPQMLIWLPTLHRMQVAEMVSHKVKCNSCRLYPLIGLRYKCLECLTYNLCQACFFTGRTSKRHKLNHPMQEYCYETSSRDRTLAFLRMLKNKLCGSSYQLQQLSIQPHDETCEVDGSQEDIALISSSESQSNTPTIIHEPLEVKSLSELQSIINRLEEINKFLLQTVSKLRVEEGSGTLNSQLREHHILVATQVERLKRLQHNFLKMNTQDKYRHVHLQSTPLHRNSHTLELSNISPIFKEENENKLPAAAAGDKVNHSNEDTQTNEACSNATSLTDVSARDLSTWVVDRVEGRAETDPSELSIWTQDPNSNQKLEELDTILEKLQHVLDSNFSLEDKSETLDRG